MKATTRIVLPHFQGTGKPFVLLFWSRDPDMSQHNAKDSVGEMVPGINGPSGLAGTRNADTMLGELLAYSESNRPGQDHRCLRHRRSWLHHHQPCQRHQPVGASRSLRAAGGPAVRLPGDRSGGHAWACRCGAPGDTGAPLDFSNGGKLPGGSGMLGSDPRHPDVVVAANGGSDLIYLPAMNAKDPGPAKEMAGDIVKFLLTQDYVSGSSSMTGWANFPARCP